jgi:hypothetical protein
MERKYKNMKNILKKSAILIILVLVAAACNSKTKTLPEAAQPSSGSGQTQTQTPTPPPQSTYNDSKYNFSFSYPNSFLQVNPTYGNLSNQIIQVQLGNTDYPKTNFGDAGFNISQEAASNLAECLKFQYPAAPSSATPPQKEINGTNYYVLTGGGAGAGNSYSSTIYRTFMNSNCFELNETIHTTDIGNYTPGTVTQIDTAPIQVMLDGILNSFNFTTK